MHLAQRFDVDRGLSERSKAGIDPPGNDCVAYIRIGELRSQQAAFGIIEFR